MTAKKKAEPKKATRKKISPSAKKRIEPSKKPTTKGKDLPKSVQWLLGFANLGSKPGELNLNAVRISGLQEIKRPPVDPPHHCGRENHLRNTVVVKDMHYHWWTETIDGSEVTFYRGKKGDLPSPKEYKDFFRKTRIKNNKRDDCLPPLRAWFMVCSSLSPNVTIVAEHFIYRSYKYRQIPIPKPDEENLMLDKLINGLEYPHDNTLTQVACAYILDFWHNHRELRQHVRQCRCCGKFWIEKTRKKYCCKKCEDRFNQASRQSVRESRRTQRKKLSKDEKTIAPNEIINWLRKRGCTKKEAEKEYEDEKRRNINNVKSLANFKRTYGKKSGLI